MQKAVAKERYQLILIGSVISFFSAAILAAARLFGWIPHRSPFAWESFV